MAGDQWSGLWGERGGAVEGRAVMNSGGKGGAWHQFCVEAISGTRRVLPVGPGSATARSSPLTLERMFPREGKEA